MDLKSQTIQTYRKNAKLLSAQFDSFGTRIEDVNRAFSLVDTKNPRVLEIGCGNGRDAVEMRKYTKNYIWVDISPELIEIATGKNSGAIFEVADIAQYSFPEDLDIVFSFASLLHSNKTIIKKTVTKISRSLNTDGVFYVSLKYWPYQKVVKKCDAWTRIFYYYLPEDIKNFSWDSMEVVYENLIDFWGSKWFTLALRKKY